MPEQAKVTLVMHYQFPTGRVISSGFFYQNNRLSKPQQQHILTLWSHQCQLYRLPCGWVLRLPSAVPCFVMETPATPLIQQARGLSNVAWLHPNNEDLASAQQPLQLLIHGQLQQWDLAQVEQVSPAQWLDVSHFTAPSMQPLGAIAATIDRTVASNKEVRSVINDDSLAASEQLNQTLRQLQQITQTGQLPAQPPTALRHRLWQWWQRRSEQGAKALKPGAQLRTKGPTSTVRGKTKARNANSQSAGRSAGPSLFDRLKNTIENILGTSPLANVLGNAQAKYFQDMMEKLQHGDLDDALRHAVPLASLQDALTAQQRRLAKLTPRDSLSIQTHSSSNSSITHIEDNALAQLKKIYEAAFRKKDAAGDFKKAAFILAELLRDIDRAVNYLEKHGQFTLAAELAEGQNLPAERVIRQWILAGDSARAINIALISGKYQEAITALEKHHKKAADELRWYLAQLHYQCGNLSSAIDIAWPLPAKRDTVLAWLRQSAVHGGELSARHLVIIAVNDEHQQEHWQQVVAERLATASHSDAMAIYRQLVREPESTATQQLATIACRSYLCHVAEARLTHDTKLWQQLLASAGDQALRADARNLNLRSLHKPKSLASATELSQHSFGLAHGREALDVLRLADDHYLIAFGEAGVELWHPSGRRLHSYSVPCHQLVGSDEGTAALLICLRSNYQIVSKWNSYDRSCKHWLEASLSCWSDNYDGLSWLVGQDNAVLLLDATASELVSLWRVDQLEGSVQQLQRNSEKFSFGITHEQGFDIWTYQLPNLYLKARTPFRALQDTGQLQPLALSADGFLVGIKADSNDEELLAGIMNPNQRVSWLEDTTLSSLPQMALTSHWWLIVSETDDHTMVELRSTKQGTQQPVLQLDFSQSGAMHCRFEQNFLHLLHASGRLLSIDLDNGEIKKDWIL